MADTGGELNPPKKIDNREEKLRLVRERQAEERQKRLEELKKHALEAQQLREQKEIERRKRMEELRQKENERRSQVEERKRQIWEAEKERREAIVRKNQEREARLETKRRNERSSIVFAFGSSTPRLMDSIDSGTFWGPRKATSTANLRLFPTTTPTIPLTRRPSEREGEPKKRASSAGGLYRNPGDQMSTSMYEVFHWDTEPTKPRLSLAPQTDPSLSQIDFPVAHSVPQTPVHPKTFRVSHIGAGDGEDNSGGNAATLRAARRKTDLMPTIPSPRDGTSSRPSSGSRSLARTPGRAYSMARLDVLSQPRIVHTNHFSQTLSGPSKSMSRSTNHLVENRRFQSNSLGKSDTSKSMIQLQSKGSSTNFLQPRMTRAQRLRNKARAAAASSKSLSPTDGHLSPGDMTPSRPGSVLSQFSATSASTPRLRSTPRRPRPFSIHVTGVSKEKIISPSEEKPKAKETKEMKVTKPPAPKPQPQPQPQQQPQQQQQQPQSVTKKQNQQKNEDIKKTQPKSIENNKNVIENNNIVELNNKVNANEKKKLDVKKSNAKVEKVEKVENNVIENKSESVVPGDKDANVADDVQSSESVLDKQQILVDIEQNHKAEVPQVSEAESNGNGNLEDESAKDNVMSRSKITTEEEAKAALAERRRLAREQAEREAEAERLRLEMEAQKEAERLRKEEEEQRLAEEEQLRLLEEARRAEEDRLMQAIQEAQKREEEEKERLRLEEQARLEKEEAERKAREEAEKQRIEMAERLKREEEERQARRKRVEAIMKRTRNNQGNSTNKADCEKGEEDGTEHEKDDSKGNLEAFLHGERISAERSLMNGQPSKDHHKQTLDNMIGNNQSNGVVAINTSGLANEDCLNSNSTMVTPLIAFQGKTKETPVAANYMA